MAHHKVPGVGLALIHNGLLKWVNVQQLIQDVAGKPFPAAMRELVLDRIGMKSSTFEQPLSPAREPAAASGHRGDGAVLPGRWHVYPELAPAGLWTTPTDLIRIGLELAKSSFGRSNRVLSLRMAKQMLSPQTGGFGLGVGLSKEGAPGFMHAGANAGFRCLMIVLLDSGNGAVIMTNGDNGDQLYGEILQSIMSAYHWPRSIF